jgi:hypothetical protein
VAPLQTARRAAHGDDAGDQEGVCLKNARTFNAQRAHVVFPAQTRCVVLTNET